MEEYIENLTEFNHDLMDLNIKYSEEIERLNNKYNKAIELIKRSAGYKGICTQTETDTFSTLLLILQGSDKE